jgi:hypothetical protein
VERQGETDLLRRLRPYLPGYKATVSAFYAALMDSRDLCLRGRRADHAQSTGEITSYLFDRYTFFYIFKVALTIIDRFLGASA